MLFTTCIGLVALATIEWFARVAWEAQPSEGPVLDAYRNYYRHYVVNILQYDRTCGRYDDELSYTLRPGRFPFSAREFNVQFSVNSEGLRDDEESMRAPHVIVVGDSHAMGWGVEQPEAFPEVIEAALGTRVLNAGIASYGTAREFLLLDRLDLSALRWLVVQYCSNDVEENRAFVEGAFQLHVMSRDRYAHLVNKGARRRGYFPGKLTVRLLPRIAKALVGAGANAPPDDARALATEVEALAKTLAWGLGRIPETTRVLVVECNSYGRCRAAFPAALRQAMEALDSAAADRVDCLDLSAAIRPSDQFLFDDHLRASGHERIGKLIAKHLAAADEKIIEDHREDHR